LKDVGMQWRHENGEIIAILSFLKIIMPQSHLDGLIQIETLLVTWVDLKRGFVQME